VTLPPRLQGPRPRPERRRLAVATAAVGVLLVTGLGGALAAGQPLASTALVDGTDGELDDDCDDGDRPVEVDDVEVGAADALAVAGTVSNDTVVGLELFTSVRTGDPVWEVALAQNASDTNETLVYVDAVEGTVPNVRPAGAGEVESEVDPAAVQTPASAAVAAATEEADGVVTEAEPFAERVALGPVWELELVESDGEAARVFVDGVDGDVLGVRTDLVVDGREED
jgi:uncharacterized membrane protein YkoI